MERELWEYYSITLEADTHQFPIGQNLPVYSVQALIPQLNAIGAKGWELVSAEPHLIGANGDIGFGIAGAAGTRWTNSYVCLFKRRKLEGP